MHYCLDPLFAIAVIAHILTGKEEGREILCCMRLDKKKGRFERRRSTCLPGSDSHITIRYVRPVLEDEEEEDGFTVLFNLSKDIYSCLLEKGIQRTPLSFYLFKGSQSLLLTFFSLFGSDPVEVFANRVAHNSRFKIQLRFKLRDLFYFNSQTLISTSERKEREVRFCIPNVWLRTQYTSLFGVMSLTIALFSASTLKWISAWSDNETNVHPVRSFKPAVVIAIPLFLITW